MTDYSQVPIIQCSYQFALETQRISSHFPKTWRYQFGDRLATLSQVFLDATIKANAIRDLKQRWLALDALSAQLLTIQMMLRMSKDLKGISSGQFASISARVEDIQKQLTAWTKWTRSNIAKGDNSRNVASS